MYVQWQDGNTCKYVQWNFTQVRKFTGIATVHCIDLRGSKKMVSLQIVQLNVVKPNATNKNPPQNIVFYISFLYWAYHI